MPRRARRRIYSLFFGLILTLFFVTPSAALATTVQEDIISTGEDHLFSGTVDGVLQAYTTFKTAQADYSCDPVINAYLALTRLLNLCLTDESGALTDLLAKFGIRRSGDSLDTLDFEPDLIDGEHFTVPETAPSGEAVRAFLADTLLPAINDSIANLNTTLSVWTADGDKHIISKTKLDSDVDIEVDTGDIYLFRAMLKFAKSAILIVTSYDLDVDVREIAALVNIDEFNPKELLARYQNFLNLLTTSSTPSVNGGGQLADARSALIGAIEDYLRASSKIRNDTSTDSGAEELIELEPCDLQNEQFLRDNLSGLKDSLNHGTVFQFVDKEGTSWVITDQTTGKRLKVELWENDSQGDFEGLDGCGFIGCAGSIDCVVIDGDQITLTLSPDYYGDVTFTGTLNQAGDQITGGSYSGWTSRGNVSGRFTAERTNVELDTTSINLNPLFGNGSGPYNLRDFLPDLNCYGEPVHGTMGHGLGNDATLGGIFPDFTQDDWGLEGISASGEISIPQATINVQDGSVTDWDGINPVYRDVTGDGDPSHSGSDLQNVYLAKDSSFLYGRMTLADGPPNTATQSNPWQALGYFVQFRARPDLFPGGLTVQVDYLDGNWRVQVWEGQEGYHPQALSTYTAGYAEAVGNDLEWKVPLADIGSITGRFIATWTEWIPYSQEPIDENETCLQIGPLSSISGTLNVPAYDGTGPIYIGVYRSENGAFNPEDNILLGKEIIYPADYTSGMTYTVDGLPVGEEVFVAARWDADFNGVFTPGDYTTFSSVFTTKQGGNNIDLGVTEEGAVTGVSGRVTDSLGNGIQNVWVSARTAPCGGQWLAGTSTDLDGEYTLTGLPAGDIYINACASCSGLNYVDKWYSGVYNCNDAIPVTVISGQVRSHIDFTMETGGTISGHVYKDEGTTPINNMHVYAADFNTNKWVAGTFTAQDGSYSLVVPTGTYRVRACASCSNLSYIDECYNNTTSWDQATAVAVTAPNDTPGIDFTLSSTLKRATEQAAVGDALTWLAQQQNPDGSWGTQYALAKTGFAVLAFEKYARDQGLSPLDTGYKYYPQVQNGLNYIYANAYTTPVTPQPAGNPDGDGDGVGVYFAMSDDSNHTTYYTAIAAMAVAASGEPNEMVSVSGSPVNGWTYAQVIQDVVDYLAWGQTDSGPGRGGWNYGPTNNDNTRSDQSNTGYVTLALAYAEAAPPEGMGVAIPGFVRSELEYWINYIQDPVDGDENDGGSWYSEPGSPDDASPNVLKTGNLLQQMAFVGETTGSSPVRAAIDYMVRNWNSWDLEGSPLCYQSSYTTMKGLEAIGAEIIGSINWFQDLSDRIRTQQSQEGWWPVSCYDDGDGILSTEWAILTLQTAVAPTEENPDLEIIDLEVSEAAGNYTVLFTLKNRGNVPAPLGHVVALKVDGTLVDQVSVNSELAPGETWSASFAPRAVSGIRDAVQVCADETDVVAELNEDNNCSGRVWPPIGDISGDRFVTLADAILALQVSAGLSPDGVQVSGDVDGDGKIGLAEAIYVLQNVAGLMTYTPTPSVAPYASDANTVLLDHFDGATLASILAYSETGAACGSEKPSATPIYSFGFGPNGLSQAIALSPPVGEPSGSCTYLKYPGGQLLSQPNGTIEFWIYLASYGTGLSLVEQGPFPGSCAGWTFAMGVGEGGQLRASAWDAFNMNSGTATVPLNMWTHVAASWGSAGAKLYLNGALVGSDTNTGMPASGYGGSVMVNYGAGAVSTQIDELRISNVQRTSFSTF